MECFGPECASMLLEWLRARTDGSVQRDGSGPIPKSEGAVQQTLWSTETYRDDSPTIGSDTEYRGAIEHLEYAIFRRYQNQLTRAERSRLDNTIHNTIFKLERYVQRLGTPLRDQAVREVETLKAEIQEHRELSERLKIQARRADQKLAQLANLTPEGFEEFVGELFEALGYDVEAVGGSGDEGADLRSEAHV